MRYFMSKGNVIMNDPFNGIYDGVKNPKLNYFTLTFYLMT